MFAWPAKTRVDRTVPKSKILENARVSSRLRSSLTNEVREIRWIAKLAPETVKLSATPEVSEIAVFQVSLKTEAFNLDLLDLFDKVIAPPILFSLKRPDGSIAHSAAYKRPHETRDQQWITGPRFTTSFRPQPSSVPPLPAAIDLARLYAAILAPLLPLSSRTGELLSAHVARCETFLHLRRQIAQLTAKMHREKQFNRKVALNQQLQPLKSHLHELSSA